MKEEVFHAAVLFLLIVAPLVNAPLLAAGQTQHVTSVMRKPGDSLDPAVNDPGLKVETVATGLNHPTAMAFLGSSNNDILVTEKDSGAVRRIIDGHVQKEPVIEVAVANDNGTNERGLLGMAISKPYVFLYYTESGDGQTGSDSKGVVPAGNRIYRYEMIEEGNSNDGTDHTMLKLVHPKLLLDLPARPGPRYEGGKLLVRQEQNDGTANNNNSTLLPQVSIFR